MKLNRKPESFVPFPEDGPLVLCWPTPNRNLFTAPERFFARTRVNPDYGRPGWTRDCGKRFHRGCDIAPVQVTPAGHTARVTFTDCATGRDFESDEPVFIPHDEVFAVAGGTLCKVCREADRSDFGLHVVLEHRWPKGKRIFYTMYAHLAKVDAEAGEAVHAGQRLGRMGQTSRDADARNWMAIAPHLHFEIWDSERQPCNPEAFLRAFLKSQD